MPTFASYLLWPIYWICQGCVCTGLWVLAHECGHYAFSDSKTVCDVVGLVLHSALLVPYHSWRISHSKHHRSTNDLDFDEVYVPRTRAQRSEKNAKTPSIPITFLNLVRMLLMGWPAHLFVHARGRRYHTHTDHFNPKSPLFTLYFILYFVLYRNNQIYKKGQSQRLKWLGQHNNNRGLLKEQTGLTNLQN